MPDTLFNLNPPAPRQQPSAGGAITVAFDSPLYREFDYALPAELVGCVQPGQRVEVPFGRRNTPTVGFCVRVPEQWHLPRLKLVSRVIDAQPLIDANLMALAQWVSEYCVCPVGRALASMVPSAVKRQVGLARRTKVYLLPALPGGEAEAATCGEAVGGDTAVPVVRESDGEDAHVTERKLHRKQQGVVDALVAAGATSVESAIEINDLAQRAGCTRGPVQKVIAAGLAVAFEQEYLPGQRPPDAKLTDPDFELNDLQRGALDRLIPRVRDAGFSGTLLHGVTSSGKTEIYLRMIREALTSGRQALVLIPEIALTTQAVDRYCKRLGSVAVIHSGLSDGQRYQAWERIARGDYQVVLGTLSAVFAPAPRLGLIIVDEEQEPSFKHLKSPRYNARDVAIRRAELLGIPIVFGSATPSLETWYNAQHASRFEYIRLSRRVSDLPMPKVRVVDMKTEARERRGIHLLSRLLEQQIARTVEAKEQAVLLLNRRGYSSYVFCSSCRFVMACDRCRSNLTYHKSLDVGLCHQCGRRYSVPANCPVCQHKLIRFGLGTQRIEEELKRLFPTARCIRVDSDTMRHAGDYQRALGDFEAGHYDLMLGTQMIAKGLDFPNVTLVGVVSADTTLAIPDFRASERTFQLVSQVAGRAGRKGGQGRVVIQTLHPELPAIKFAVEHDYVGFANSELPMRQDLGYPPFAHLALFILRHGDEAKARTAAEQLAERLELIRAADGAGWAGQVRGPMAAPIPRIRDQYRYHVLLSATSAADMQRWLGEARRQGALEVAADWVVDVDPLALM